MPLFHIAKVRSSALFQLGSAQYCSAQVEHHGGCVFLKRYER